MATRAQSSIKPVGTAKLDPNHWLLKLQRELVPEEDAIPANFKTTAEWAKETGKSESMAQAILRRGLRHDPPLVERIYLRRRWKRTLRRFPYYGPARAIRKNHSVGPTDMLRAD